MLNNLHGLPYVAPKLFLVLWKKYIPALPIRSNVNKLVYEIIICAVMMVTLVFFYFPRI